MNIVSEGRGMGKEGWQKEKKGGCDITTSLIIIYVFIQVQLLLSQIALPHRKHTHTQASFTRMGSSVCLCVQNADTFFGIRHKENMFTVSDLKTCFYLPCSISPKSALG